MSAITWNGRIRQEAERLIYEEIENLKTTIAAGNASSFEDYKRKVGEIYGLQKAVDLLSEAESICNGKER